MSHSKTLSFSDVLQGEPVELQELEKEISHPLLIIDSPMNQQSQADIEALIVDALMRRSCNPIQIHLRLKQGFNPDATLHRSELNELSSLFFSHNNNAAETNNSVKNKDSHKEQCRAKARELAKFYVRIANIRARIMEEQQHQRQYQEQQKHREKDEAIIMDGKLQRAYATQKENMHNKQRENQEHFARIMRTIILNPDNENRCIHPEVKESDIDVLELQVQDIIESGCATNELRCMKIMEAAIEQQKYDALIAELNAMDE